VIWNRTGGSDDGPLLVLLHGLGGTAELWRGVEEQLPQRWAGGWMAVDLPGHGRSSYASSYTFGAQAFGSEDKLVREANYRDLGVDVVRLDGLGHNPHVEDPAALAALL